MKRGFAFPWKPDSAIPWQSKPHKFFFWFFAVCLALYITYVAFVSQSRLFITAADTAATLLWTPVIGACVLAALLWFSRSAGDKPLPDQRARISGRMFAAGCAVSFAILGVFLLAAYPGGVSVDSAVQWTQAGTGQYSNWHPVFHTLLLRLSMLLKPEYTFALVLQCAVFSLCAGYLTATLHAWGAKALPLLIVQGLTVAAPIVGNTMMYLWKDNAMTIGVTVLCAHAVNLYLSRGAWLAKPRNAVAFGLALAFTTLVRHNAMLFTVPLLLTAAFAFPRQARGALTAAAALIMALALVWGPLYTALHVTYPSNTLEESIGVPMTVISNIKKQNPDALDAETRAFTDAMADEAGWEAYTLNNYNSIKFGATRELISRTTLAQVLRMAANAAKADPRAAFAAVNGVTDLVWGVNDEGSANVTVRNSGDLPGVPKGTGALNALGGAIKAVITAPFSLNVLSWYYGNLGVSLLLMLVLSLRALRQNGVRALLLCLPTLLYNLGTMCVLCGNDARFFSFSPLVCTLSVFVLTRKAPALHPNTKEKIAQ